METIRRDALFSAWEQSATPAEMPAVLCATRRLADDLVRDYGRYRSARGDRAWPAPPCEAWRSWLQRRFEQHTLTQAMAGVGAPPRLLSDAETRALWREVVESGTRDRPLLQTGRMAEAALQAWTTAHDHRIALPLRVPDDEDADAFDAWSSDFVQRLRALDGITGAELPAWLCGALAGAALSAPPHLVLAALERPTPAQQALFDALATAGTQLQRLDSSRVADGEADIRHLPCTDTAAELDAVARAVLDRARTAPDTRIGVVVPDLDRRLDALRRRFDAVLCPWLAPGDNPAERPYAISKGAPLSEQPVIAAALDWLEWIAAPHGAALATASRCLLSPYWRGAEAPDRLVHIDHRLRERRHEQVALSNALVAGAPVVGPILGRVGSLAGETLPPSGWAQRFAQALDRLGWPGTLDSAEYQAHRAWNEALAAFGRLDAITGKLRARAALQRLRGLLGEQDFQPQGGDAHVQVLGLLEAAGLSFDSLFVLGMDEHTWPPEARPIALLPEGLQRARTVPQATAEGQLERAQAITADLLRTAPIVHFSWPTLVDEQAARPSPLLPAATGTDDATGTPLAAAHPPAWQALHDRTASEAWEDGQATPPEPAEALPGSTYRLGEHAECPFRAVAHHGLAADAPEAPEAAPDPMERGILAHEVMAAIWRRLRGSEALHALDDAAQKSLVEQAVDGCLARAVDRAPHRFTPGVVAVESLRLCRIAADLLALDRARLPFEVEMIEGALPEAADDRADHDIDVHGLRLRLRPDRVDHVPGVGRIVIDYKTGQASTPVGHTLNAPQLMVYAELVEDCVGVAYAVLRGGETGYVGVIDNEAAPAMPQLTRVEKLQKKLREEVLGADDWPAVRRLWDAQLQAVADDIRQGVADVAPLPGVCPRCDLQALCRVHERDAFATTINGEQGE